MQLASYYSYRFSYYYTPQSYKNIALTGLNAKIVDANFLSLAACKSKSSTQQGIWIPGYTGDSLTHPWIGPRPLVGHGAVCASTSYTLRFCSPTYFLGPNLGRNKMASRTRLSLRLRCHRFKGRALKFHSRGGGPGDEARISPSVCVACPHKPLL